MRLATEEERLAILAEEQEEKANEIRYAINNAKLLGLEQQGVKKISDDINLAKRTGVPFELVNGKENEPFKERLLEKERIDGLIPVIYRIAKNAPASAKFLSDPKHVILAMNDIDKLEETEGYISIAKRSLKSNYHDTQINLLTGKLVTNIAMSQSEQDAVKKQIEEHKKQKEALGDTPSYGLREYVWQAVSMFPQIYEQVKEGGAYGAILGGMAGAAFALKTGALIPFPEEVVTVPTATGWGALKGYQAGALRINLEMEAGAAYNEFSDIQGVSHEAARGGALVAGVLNTVIETASIGTFVKSFPGGEKIAGNMIGRQAIKAALANPTAKLALAEFGKKYAKTLTLETMQEMAQEAITMMAGAALRHGADLPQVSAEENIERLIETGVQSAKAMSLIMLPGPALGLKQNLARAKADKDSIAAIAKAADIMDTTEVKNLSKEKAKEFIKETVKDTEKETAYIDSSALLKLFQEGQISEEDAKSLNLTEAELAGAEASGHDAEIPMEVLLTLNKELRDQLLPITRTEPDGLTAEEAKALEQKMEGLRSEELFNITASLEWDERVQKSAASIYESKRTQLETLGKDGESARADAALIAKMYTELSAKYNKLRGTNMLPDEYAKLYPLHITRDEAGTSVFMQNSYQKRMMEETSKKWNAIVDEVYSSPAGTEIRGQSFVMNSPLVLSLVGGNFKNSLGKIPILINTDKIRKIKDGEGNEHYLTKEQIKQLPKAMADPIAIFESSGNAKDPSVNDIVMMLEIKDKTGATVVAPIWLEQNEKGLVFNKLASFYGKERNKRPNDKWFSEQVSEGRLMYINTKKADYWSGQGGLPILPAGNLSNQLSLNNIPTQADLVKLLRENPTYNQPLNGDVDPDALVDILDLTHEKKLKINSAEAKNFSKKWKDAPLIMEKGKGEKEVKARLYRENPEHPFWSSKQTTRYDSSRLKSLNVLDKLLENAVKIESYENQKISQKPNVKTVHRFYTPVRTQSGISVIRITAFEMKDESIGIDGVDIYDVMKEKNIPKTPYDKATSASSTTMKEAGEFSENKISIREMLKDVKDAFGTTYFQEAYHGSPYRFDNFSTLNIGRGEGAQAFGYGLYFAGNKDVAEWYRKRLTEKKNRTYTVELDGVNLREIKTEHDDMLDK